MRRLTRRQRLSAIVLAVVAVCFITLDLGGGSLSNAHTGVRGALGSLYRGTDSLLGPARRWVQGVPSAGTNTGRIQALRRDNAKLRGQLSALRGDARTSARLKALQQGADRTGATLLAARVTAYGPGSGFDWTVTLDAGSSGGVRSGQTVTDGAGLVGRVLHTDADSCVVLLAADPGSGVGVRDTTTGEIGVATGQGSAGFTFAPLKPTATVHVGDQLQTGPTGSSTFVSGISLGRITSVRRSADGTVRAQVSPTAAPTALDIVAVVVAAPHSLAASAPLQPTGQPR